MIRNGSRVRVIDEGDEVFTVSQLADGTRCWIGDENNRGWYITLDRLELVEDEDEYDGRGGMMLEFPKTYAVAQALTAHLQFQPMDKLDYQIFAGAANGSQVAYCDYIVIREPNGTLVFIEADEDGTVIQEVAIRPENNANAGE